MIHERDVPLTVRLFPTDVNVYDTVPLPKCNCTINMKTSGKFVGRNQHGFASAYVCFPQARNFSTVDIQICNKKRCRHFCINMGRDGQATTVRSRCVPPAANTTATAPCQTCARARKGGRATTAQRRSVRRCESIYTLFFCKCSLTWIQYRRPFTWFQYGFYYYGGHSNTHNIYG